MYGRAEQVNAMPAAERFVRHAFLHRRDSSPRRWIGTREANIFATVGVAGKAFVGDTLVRRHAVRAVMAKAAVVHVPAMQQRAGGQGGVPSERRQPTGGAVRVDQLEELRGDLLRFAGDGRWPVGSRQTAIRRWC